MSAPIRPQWTPREPPLPAVAVAGTDDAGVALRAAAVARIAAGAVLRASTGDGWTLILGDLADLPWADGAIYLGQDAGLLVPATMRPSLPAGVLRAAFGPSALAVLPGRVLAGPAPIRPADPASLA
ncbi:MAG: hypothetical protein ABW224_25300 [Kibdelosporangium sp.]